MNFGSYVTVQRSDECKKKLALSRNVGKLREMKKAHEDMAMDITVLKLENSELRRKFPFYLLCRLLYQIFLPNFGCFDRCTCRGQGGACRYWQRPSPSHRELGAL